MRWRQFTSRWCSPSSSTLLQPAEALLPHQINVGLKHTYDARFGSTSIKTLIPLCHNLLRTPMTFCSKTFSSILNMFFTTSCQAELNTHVNCDLADTTVLWLLSLTPETSLLDSCSKTGISLHKLIFKKLFLPSYCTLLRFVNFSLKIWLMDGCHNFRALSHFN